MRRFYLSQTSLTAVLKTCGLLVIMVILFTTFVRSPLETEPSKTFLQALTCIQQHLEQQQQQEQQPQANSQNQQNTSTMEGECAKLLQAALEKHMDDEKPGARGHIPGGRDIDCYGNIPLSSQAQYPLKITDVVRNNYLDSFVKCGHFPIQVSNKIITVESDNLPVPKVVHYIWFYDLPHEEDFEFLQYLSIFSVNKYIKPQYIMWHGNVAPRGYWWDKVKQDIPNIFFVPWEPLRSYQGHRITKKIFASDVLRLMIISIHGGIYIDNDILVLKSFDSLRQHELVMGRELRFTLANGVIVAKPWSIFLRMMLDFYHSFDGRNWAKTSMMEPNRLSTLFPTNLYVEERNLIYPSWPDVKKLYEGTFDWKKNYCVHILGEEKFGHLLPNNTEQLDRADFTLGAIMREIYYGDTKVRGV